jgi:hypothetical protein
MALDSISSPIYFEKPYRILFPLKSTTNPLFLLEIIDIIPLDPVKHLHQIQCTFHRCRLLRNVPRSARCAYLQAGLSWFDIEFHWHLKMGNNEIYVYLFDISAFSAFGRLQFKCLSSRFDVN